MAAGIAEKLESGNWRGYRAVRWDSSGAAAVELGNLGSSSGGVTNTFAYAINSAGRTVGSAEKIDAGQLLGDRAVRWDPSGTGATELGNLGTDSNGATVCGAYAVNSSGLAVGTANKFSGGFFLGSRAVRWDAAGTTATELGHLGTSSGMTTARAYAVNDDGTAVGYAFKYEAGVYGGERAVRWHASGTAATELGHLGTNSSGATTCYAFAVNNGGTAAGYVQKYEAGVYKGWRAVRWDAAGTAATELGILGTTSEGFSFSISTAINGAGTAVGAVYKFDAGVHTGSRAVRWDASGTSATELGNLGTDGDGYTESGARAIHATGTTVGFAHKHDAAGNYVGAKAVVWGHDGIAVDLNTLLSPADAAQWILTDARGISDTAWVTGYGVFDPDGAGGQGPYGRMFLLFLGGEDCRADFDGDGFVTGIDYDMYVSAFEAGDMAADFDGDEFVTGIDFDLYVASYEAGC